MHATAVAIAIASAPASSSCLVPSLSSFASFPAPATGKATPHLRPRFSVSRNGRSLVKAAANADDVDGDAMVHAPRPGDGVGAGDDVIVSEPLVVPYGLKRPEFLLRLRERFWGSSSVNSSLDVAPPSAPAPPFTGGFISLLGLLLVLGVIFNRWMIRASGRARNARQEKVSDLRKAPAGISVFSERNLRKESVGWINMVLGKLWKAYRSGLESWIVGQLQPLIDKLQKPSFVERVEIKQFYLGDEPISVRSVERRASRRANDRQYQIGLRYTGSARILLDLRLKSGFIPVIIPVVVRSLDVDGEVWLKLGLIPSGPRVGTVTWAFVSLPRIKLEMSTFRFFNLMAIPFLSGFLSKLLTQDLPQLFVRPNKNVINFVKGSAAGSVSNDFKGASLHRFSGELSITLVDARKLDRVPYGKTDPYVVLILGDQVINSKRNSQTTVVGPPGNPIWNQDFQLRVIDPKTQRLGVQVRDYFGLMSVTLGVGEVDLSALQDNIPADILVGLTTVGWAGPFVGKRFAGEVLLRLTYTAYVEDEEDEDLGLNDNMSDINENPDTVPLLDELACKFIESVGRDSDLMAIFERIIAELDNEGSEFRYRSGIMSEDFELLGSKTTDGGNRNTASSEARTTDGRTTLLWLALVTGVVILVDVSLNFSNLLNP